MPGRRSTGAGGRARGSGNHPDRAVEGDVALFAHGHVLRVLVARWLGLPVSAGQHLTLDTATLSVLGRYNETPVVRIWNGPLLG
jgi:probable phosphoglycerate mutase